MKLDIEWSASVSGEAKSVAHYKGALEGQPVADLVISPRITESGLIIGAFAVENSEMFDSVAASAAVFAAKDSGHEELMPKVVPITNNAGLITQPK